MVRNPTLVWDPFNSFLFLICDQRLVKLLDRQELSFPVFLLERELYNSHAEHRGKMLEQWPWLPGLCKGEGLGSMFFTVMTCNTQGSTVTSQLGPTVDVSIVDPEP